jgi:NUMOD3 motif
MKFYAYLWLREDGTPYYAGKGQKDRAFHSDGHGVHRPRDNDRILLFYRTTEAEALETEKELIRNWGRQDLGTGCLRNLSAGGEIPVHLSPESLKKMSAAHKGKHHSLATEFKSETWKGKKRNPFSAEHRRKLSEAHKGCRGFTGAHSEETKERIRRKKLGKLAPDITKQRMSESQKLAWLKRKARGTVQLFS